jgi:hypothetical protein
MRATSTLPIRDRHDRSRVTLFDHVRVFIVTIVFSAAVTFIIGSALLGLR